MKAYHWLAMTIIAGFSAAAGAFVLTPYVLADRVSANVKLGGQALIGTPKTALPSMIAQYEQALLEQPVQLALRDKTITRSLGKLGLSLDREAASSAIQQTAPPLWAPEVISPAFRLNQAPITDLVETEFIDYLTLPANAGLSVSPANTLTVTPSRVGENIDLISLAADLAWRASHQSWHEPIALKIVSAPPSVHEGETGEARALAEALLRDGLPISDGTTTWRIAPHTIRRLLRFQAVADSAQPDNQILGVTADAQEVRQYLTTTIAPAIDQPAVNARFERTGDRVTQFAIPQEGRTLDLEASVAAMQDALSAGAFQANLVVARLQPAVSDTADIEALGIANLLATGTSDFAGSPNNRRHNIIEGTSRYHGLLLPAGAEFSFNEFLGPVDGQHGFLPELVIKKNVTIPEFGGGLCQVSTTVFRAAINAGLTITARRHHSYAVSYYGTPGFDATIYPPYTDLRFTNNTPGYILIQARIEGVKVTIEFWGTDDKREVTVTGPHPYDRAPDGAVKATLNQKVTRDGEVIIDETFYSRYRSPNLFPKVNANPTPSPTPLPPA